MIDESSVTPVDPNAITPISLEQPPLPSGETPVSSEASLPDEVLQIPSIQAIMSGAPPAVSFNVKAAEKTPEAKLIGANKQGLQENGVGFYRSLAGDTGVMFNSLKISGEDIKAADAAGKLLEIAPDAAKVSADIMQSGANHPALNSGAPPSGLAAPQGALPPQSAQMPMTDTAPANRQKLAAQLKMLQPQAPTSGAHAGQGNLLRSIMRPVL